MDCFKSDFLRLLPVTYLCGHFLLLGSSERKGQKDKRPLPLLDNQPSKRPGGELTHHEGKSNISRSSAFQLLTYWFLNETASNPPLIPRLLLEYFRASESTKINHKHGNHWCRTRFQDIVYLRESSFNMTRGDEDIEGGPPKIVRHPKGGLRKFVYFKTNRRGSS